MQILCRRSSLLLCQCYFSVLCHCCIIIQYSLGLARSYGYSIVCLCLFVCSARYGRICFRTLKYVFYTYSLLSGNAAAAF